MTNKDELVAAIADIVSEYSEHPSRSAQHIVAYLQSRGVLAGDGGAPDAAPSVRVQCTRCDGSGMALEADEDDGATVLDDCRKCGGDGFIEIASSAVPSTQTNERSAAIAECMEIVGEVLDDWSEARGPRSDGARKACEAITERLSAIAKEPT